MLDTTNELISTQKGMTSLEIAEITRKRHDAILRDIRNLLKQGVSHHNFVETFYKQPQPRGGYKELPCFSLTPKGCLILASGYDALLRERIINRLEELDKGSAKVPQTFSESLMLAANQARQIENLKEENHLLLLVISELYFSENIANSTNSCIFAVLTVQQTLLLRRAAVNCSIVIGRFLCSIFKDIKRLSIRSHCFVLRSKVCWTVSSVYGNRFSVAYNDLNAYSHGK